MIFIRCITRISYFFPVTFLTTKIDIQCQVEMDKVNITGKQNIYSEIVLSLVSFLNRSLIESFI